MPTDLHDWVPGLLGGLAAFADGILGVGIVLPGEALVTGLATTVDGDQVGPFIVLVILGASVGDHLNFMLGRHFGSRLATSRVVTVLGVRHWDRGVQLLQSQGPRAIVLTRLIPVVRTLVPAIAGAGGLTYRRFLPASLIGSALWALTWVLAGSAVRHMFTGAALWAALFAGTVAVSVGLYRTRTGRRKAADRRSPPSDDGTDAAHPADITKVGP